MRGLWHATSRFFLLKIPFSDKDSGQKDKKQKNTAISNMIMLCCQTGCIVISFPKHTKKALMCSPKVVTTLAFTQRDCKGDCKRDCKGDCSKGFESSRLNWPFVELMINVDKC